MSNLTLTTTQLQPTTLRGFPSLSILQRPTHSPSFLLSSTCAEHHITSESLAISGTRGPSPEAAVLSEVLGNGWLLSSQASAEGAKVSSLYSVSLPGVTGMLLPPSTPSNNFISYYTPEFTLMVQNNQSTPLAIYIHRFCTWKNSSHTTCLGTPYTELQQCS